MLLRAAVWKAEGNAANTGPFKHMLRLEEAKQLDAGDEPVEAIANAVGYEDAEFFRRLFKRKVNLTPVQYRRRCGAAIVGGQCCECETHCRRTLSSIGLRAQSFLPTTSSFRWKCVSVEAVSPSDN